MQLQSYFIADTDQIGWSEIESMMSCYDLRRNIDLVIEKEPTKKIKVEFNVKVTIDE